MKTHKVPEPPRLEHWMTINKYGIDQNRCVHRVRSFSKKNGDGVQMCVLCKRVWD